METGILIHTTWITRWIDRKGRDWKRREAEAAEREREGEGEGGGGGGGGEERDTSK